MLKNRISISHEVLWIGDFGTR